MHNFKQEMNSFTANTEILKRKSQSYDKIIYEVGALYHVLDEARNYVADEHLPVFETRLAEEGWIDKVGVLFNSLKRWKSSNLTPVSVGVMGRMSVGKTTVLMELISPPENSPIRQMPARAQETTACAVRWINADHMESRYGISKEQILLKLMDASSDEDLIIEIEGGEIDMLGQLLPQPHLGLEVTAHPPEGRTLLLRKESHRSKVILSKRPKQPKDESLKHLAARTRLAVISSESKEIGWEEIDGLDTNLFLLNFLDLIDFPGADAINARAEVKDKAQKVFESNTHECDMMLLVISPDGGGHNLGHQIKDIVWVHWALRCILAGEPAHQRLLAESVGVSYAKYDQLNLLADFMDAVEDERNLAILSDLLTDVMEDADEFWEWMDAQRAQKSSQLCESFNFHLNQALKRDEALAALAIDQGRLGFLINYGSKLLNSDHGFSYGADACFWSAFVETTLNATSGAFEAFKNGVWPKFFMIDLPKALSSAGLVWDRDFDLAYKFLSALYHPKEPYPINDAQESAYSVWYRQAHGVMIDDKKRQVLLSQQQSEIYSEEARSTVSDHHVLLLIHDLAQSWWWSTTFKALSESHRQELYQWTLLTALRMVYQAPDESMPDGGSTLVRRTLVRSASTNAFELKIKEAEDRYQQALIRAKSLHSKIFREHVGSAEISKVSRWAAACARWGYWRSGLGPVLTQELDEYLKDSRSLAITEFKTTIIPAAVESGLKQMLTVTSATKAEPQHLLEEEDWQQFKAWILKVLTSDLTLNIYADSQLAGGRQRKKEHGRAFIRTVFMRLNVLLKWLSKHREDEEELSKALGVITSKKDFIIVRRAVGRSAEQHNYTFPMISGSEG